MKIPFLSAYHARQNARRQMTAADLRTLSDEIFTGFESLYQTARSQPSASARLVALMDIQSAFTDFQDSIITGAIDNIPAYARIKNAPDQKHPVRDTALLVAFFGSMAVTFGAPALLITVPPLLATGAGVVFVGGFAWSHLESMAQRRRVQRAAALPDTIKQVLTSDPSFCARRDAFSQKIDAAVATCLDTELPQILAAPDAQRLIDSFPALKDRAARAAIGAVPRKTMPLPLTRDSAKK